MSECEAILLQVKEQTDLRIILAALSLLCLAGCADERHFVAQTAWPFGNPNKPVTTSETAQRALGKTPEVAALQAQPGNVWPGPVQPPPTLSEVQKNATLPLGQGYTPSLPSPYPPGQPQINGAEGINDSAADQPAVDGTQAPVPAVPGDAR